MNIAPVYGIAETTDSVENRRTTLGTHMAKMQRKFVAIVAESSPGIAWIEPAALPQADGVP